MLWDKKIAEFFFLKIISLLSAETDYVSHRESRDHSGGGVVSSGYGVPADSYSAGSSSYAAPSTGYGAPSTGYGAPSAVGSSYAAPSTGYGTPSAPVYVYQQGQGQQQTNSAGGALAALLHHVSRLLEMVDNLCDLVPKVSHWRRPRKVFGP